MAQCAGAQRGVHQESWLLLAIAAFISQIVGLDLLIGKEVELFLLDRGIHIFRFRLGKQRAIFEIAKVEDHQGSHAQPLEQPDYELCHQLDKYRAEPSPSTRVKLVEDESTNVRKCEEEGDHGVCAALSPQSVLDSAMLLLLSIDSSLCLYKEPNDQQAHHNDLKEEQVRVSFPNQTNVVIKGRSVILFIFCRDNRCNRKAKKRKRD